MFERFANRFWFGNREEINVTPALPGTCTRGKCAPGDLLHLRMRLAAQRQVQVSKSSVASFQEAISFEQEIASLAWFRYAPKSTGLLNQRWLAMT